MVYLINRKIEKIAAFNPIPKKNRGKFTAWCKANGFDGVSQAAINKAMSVGGHPARMAIYAANRNPDKYHLPKKKKK